MKLNHEFVRTWIRWVSLSLFVGAVAYKFKKIIDAGKVDIDEDDDYEDPETNPNVPESEPPVGNKSENYEE